MAFDYTVVVLIAGRPLSHTAAGACYESSITYTPIEGDSNEPRTQTFRNQSGEQLEAGRFI
ncbi:hypothetical protein GCM10010911_34710 [Paenibacillus nasutitermitis]|uniref:Uncharacterized protein n=1 Tax=Paenibacillus nasutitermitis TaxID=1652958 RepID=A0A917DV28_9BACL|nr:hypothetical protein GCM10010911_34710 [Paenibacillus nasutitermitis]